MPEERMDNIPEFGSEYDHLKAQYDRLKEKEHARHGAAMFATGVVEGLRQAIYVIETERTEVQPSSKWQGMNAAIAAVERAIEKSIRSLPKTIVERPASRKVVTGLHGSNVYSSRSYGRVGAVYAAPFKVFREKPRDAAFTALYGRQTRDCAHASMALLAACARHRRDSRISCACRPPAERQRSGQR